MILSNDRDIRSMILSPTYIRECCSGHLCDSQMHFSDDIKDFTGKFSSANFTTAIRDHNNFVALRQRSGDFGGDLKTK